MERAWPDGEEHYAKLSVNALIGLWARNMDVVYTMRSSQKELDGYGRQERRVVSVFASLLPGQAIEEDAEEGMRVGEEIVAEFEQHKVVSLLLATPASAAFEQAAWLTLRRFQEMFSMERWPTNLASSSIGGGRCDQVQ